MGEDQNKIEHIRAVLEPHGIFLRGCVHFDGDGPAMAGGRAGTVFLLGNIGGSIWPAFSRWLEEKGQGLTNPLDSWSVDLIRPLAESLGGVAFFPSEKPWQPFQQWAMRAEGLQASPLGILIHPEFGLWHGYRGAIGFAGHVDHPEFDARPHPCDLCPDKPCLTACPAGAVTEDHFDVPACRTYLIGEGEGSCMQVGCLARNACPVGADYRYPNEQMRFHMAALRR